MGWTFLDPVPGNGRSEPPHLTWHDDLREAQLPGHHSGPVHQVGIIFANLNDVTHEHLHGHPEP